MSRYIDIEPIEKQIEFELTIGQCKTFSEREKGVLSIYDAIKNAPAADVQEVVRCEDCIYWKDRHVLQNDGTERQYREGEKYVNCSIGINVGAMCCYEDGQGWDGDKRVFRNKDDFCSKGKRR